MMRRPRRLLMTASVIAMTALWAYPAPSQVLNLGAEQVGTDPAVRTRAETALLYATTLDRLTRIIERDIAADPGVAVITGLRAGRLDTLPSLDPALRDLISALRIGARVMDADPDPGRTDERAIVFVADGDLRGGVTRADIEAAAREARLTSIARLQERRILGPDGAFEVPQGISGLPGAAVATYVGVRGADLVTSSGAGSETLRTIPCPVDGAGELMFGTGIVQRRDVTRTTTLGGSVTETFGDWVEVSRSCESPRESRVRIFDACTTASGGSGTAVFEVTQRVRRDPADPFGTVIELDESTKVQLDGGSCIDTDRLEESRDFLVEGGTTAPRELALRTATTADDIGSGVNTVPRVVAGEPGAGGPVPSIPFPARSEADFKYTRSCTAEYGSVPLPASSVNPSGTGIGAWYGPDRADGLDTFTGEVTWYRDYNRRETTFMDDLLAYTYILNYDVVLDPNPFGHAPKGRRTVPSHLGPPEAGDPPPPSGDGWYRPTQECTRVLDREERRERGSCSTKYPEFPNGDYLEENFGTGTYVQLLVSGAAQTPSLSPPIDWSEEWREVLNTCYKRTVTKKADERQTVPVRIADQDCLQDQYRTPWETKDTFQQGGSTTSISYNPDWTNDGAPYNCVTTYSGGGGDGGGGSWADLDGDGYGDVSIGEAESLGVSYDSVSDYSPSDVGAAIASAAEAVGSYSGSGSDGSGDSCFAPGTCVLMADGTERPVEAIRVGDVLADGGRVYMTGLFLASDLYRLDGVEVTGDHLVRGDTGWVPVRAHPRAVRLLTGERLVHNLATTRNRVRIGGLLFADYSEIAGPIIEDLILAEISSRQELREAV